MSWNCYIRYTTKEGELRYLHLACSETWGIKMFNVDSLMTIAEDADIKYLDSFFAYWKSKREESAKIDNSKSLVERLKENAERMFDEAHIVCPSITDQFPRRHITRAHNERMNTYIYETFKKIPELHKMAIDYFRKETNMVEEYFSSIQEREPNECVMSFEIISRFFKEAGDVLSAEFSTTGYRGRSPCVIGSASNYCEDISTFNALSRNEVLELTFPNLAECLVVDKFAFRYY